MSIVALTLAAEEESLLASAAFGAADTLFTGINNAFYVAAGAIGAGGLYAGYQIDRTRGSGILKKTEEQLHVVPLPIHNAPIELTPQRKRDKNSISQAISAVSSRRKKNYQVDVSAATGFSHFYLQNRHRRWRGRGRGKRARRARRIAVVL